MQVVYSCTSREVINLVSVYSTHGQLVIAICLINEVFSSSWACHPTISSNFNFGAFDLWLKHFQQMLREYYGRDTKNVRVSCVQTGFTLKLNRVVENRTKNHSERTKNSLMWFELC